MEMIQIYSLLYCILSFLITYTVGHVIMLFIKVPVQYPLLKEFSKLSSGFFFIFALYALIKTQGLSINIGIAILGLVLIVLLHKENRLRKLKSGTILKENPIKLKLVILQTLVLFLLYFFLFIKCYDPIDNQFYHVAGDIYNYARNIVFIEKSGVESIYSDLFNTISVNKSLYHYGELWYSAFYYKLFNVTAFQSFYFILFPHVLLLYVLGAAALIEVLFTKKKKNIFLMLLLILFVTGLSFYIPKTMLLTKGDWNDTALFIQPKYLFSALCIIYAVIMIYHNKYYYALLIGMAMILANIALAPSLFVSFSIGICLLFIFKRISLKDFTGLSAILLGTVFFIAGYAFFIEYLNEKNKLLPSLQHSALQDLSVLKYLKTAINCFAGQLIKSILSLGLYVIVFFLFAIKSKRNSFSNGYLYILIFLLILHISSILSYALFHQSTVDAVQLWTFVYIPLASIVCFIVIVFLLQQEHNNLAKAMALLLIGFSMFQSKLFERRHKINTLFYYSVRKEYDGSTVVFFKAKEKFSSVYDKNINQYAPIPYLLMSDKKYNPVCLSVFEIPLSTENVVFETEKIIIENSVFYRFVELQKINKKFVSIAQSQQDFVVEHDAGFAITYSTTPLPLFLQSKAKFIATDSIEGISIYKITGN